MHLDESDLVIVGGVAQPLTQSLLKQHLQDFYCNMIRIRSNLKIKMSISKLIFIFLNQNIWCGNSNEPSQ